MEAPWAKLNEGKLPVYEVEVEPDESEAGTRIIVDGFRTGSDFPQTHLSYARLENYLYWKTIIGSTAHHFDSSVREMSLSLTLDTEIDDTRDCIQTSTNLEFPPEQLTPGDGVGGVERLCKHYPPSVIDVEHEGETVQVEICGMIGGKEARNELPTYGRHSTQFGVWLATDYIKVEQINDVLSSDNEFLHFFFIANCQELELSSNRERFRNKEDALYGKVKEAIGKFLAKVSEDPWYREYQKLRQVARKQQEVEAEKKALEERLSTVKGKEEFCPRNVAELISEFHRSLPPSLLADVRLADFYDSSNVNGILETPAGLHRAAFEVQLSQFFSEDKIIHPVDVFVCWNHGDVDALKDLEYEGYQGGKIRFDLEADVVRYENGSVREIPIVSTSEGKSANLDWLSLDEE